MRTKYLVITVIIFSFAYGQFVNTIAGSGSASWQDGAGINASFNRPQGIDVDASGNIYVADFYNNRIRKITPAGEVTTLAGSSYGYQDGSATEARFRYPSDVAVDVLGNVYVADSYNNRIRKINSVGVVTTIAGSGSSGFTDALGTSARFNRPSGIAIDASGIIYVADRYNHRIRTVSASGQVTTIAGSSAGYLDGESSNARFYEPIDVDVDGVGNIYISDKNNHIVRKISTNGSVTTVAGYGGSSGSTDGSGIDARFFNPWGVTVSSNGIVYIADESNNRIRRISTNGDVTTIAGNTPGYSDGIGDDALFNSPMGIATYGDSHLYIADYDNNRIRSVLLDSNLTSNEEVKFSLAGGYSSYNIASSVSSNGSLMGGITMSASGLLPSEAYLLKVSFDQGNTWHLIDQASATIGTYDGSGSFIPNTVGSAEIEISHISLSSLVNWPGNDGTIRVRVSNPMETYHFPNSFGEQFILDLTKPEINVASISSNNLNNSSYASLGDIITIYFQSSEMLGNTTQPISGTINGNSITAIGSGIAWQVSSSVTSLDPEGITVFDIFYYDVNGNPGQYSISSTTNQSFVIVDKTAPTASNITIFSSNTDNTQAGSGDSVTVTFTANEQLSNLTEVKIAEQTILSSNIINLENNSWSFFYVLQGGEKDGVVDFTFTLNDSAGNSLTYDTPESGSVEFNADPIIISVNSSKNNGYYNAGEVIEINVNFIEEVLVTSGTPTLELETGNTDAITNYIRGSGTKTLIFTYTVSESDSSDDLDYTSANALSLNGGTIKDEAGHNANIALPDPGELNSLGRNRNIIIDNVDPVLNYVTSSQSDGTYNIGDNIYLNVVFNENIYVVGSPKLEISVSNQIVNDSSKSISFYNRSGSMARFRYQVLEGDTTSLLQYTSQSALSLNNGNIVDAAGNSASIVLPTPGSLNSLGSNRNIIIDGIAPFIKIVSSSSINDIYKINDNIDIEVEFSQPVTISGTPYIDLETGQYNGRAYYSSGANTRVLKFIYNVASGHSSADLEYINSTNALYGTIRDPSYNNASRILPLIGTENSLSGTSSIIIDGIIPNVVSISSDSPDLTYKIGDSIDIKVSFSENILVTGIPSIVLETGSNDGLANYHKGSGTNDLNFEYIVRSGDQSIDLDYSSNSALLLNNGTIKDIARNPANLELFSPDSTGSLAANKNIVIDGIAPQVSQLSIRSNNGNDQFKAGPGDVVTISVTFSEPIGTPLGMIGGYPAIISGGNNVWSFSRALTNEDVEGVVDFSIGFVDLAGNAGLQATEVTDSSSVLFDKTKPSLTSITSSNPDGTYIVGEIISIIIIFDEIVKVQGNPKLLLETGQDDGFANYTSGSGTNQIIFNYTIEEGDSSADLAYKTVNSLLLNNGSIYDIAGNLARLGLDMPGSGNSLSANKNLIVDGILPKITNVSSSIIDSTYKTGDLIPIQITFNDYVTVAGTPYLILETGIEDAHANYISGSGETVLIFNYIVKDGDISPNLDYAGISALKTNQNSVYIKDGNGNSANLHLPDPGSLNSLSSLKNIVIDGIRPSVISVTSQASNGTYKIGDQVTVNTVFSELVNVSGEPQLLLNTGNLAPSVAIYVGGTGTTVLSFLFTVSEGDTSSDLDYYSNQSFILNNSVIIDSVGNNSNLDLFEPSTNNSLSYNKDIIIDGNIPKIQLVTSSSEDGSYNEGSVIDINIHFREPVVVSGGPYLKLSTGENSAYAFYESGAESSVLIFRYEVGSGENSSKLNYIDQNSFKINDGMLKDLAGNQAELFLPNPLGNNSLSSNSNIIIDTDSPKTFFAFNEKYFNKDGWSEIGQIFGTSSDSLSGISIVKVKIKRESDGFFLSGSNWSPDSIWLSAQGAEQWVFNLDPQLLSNDVKYTIFCKSLDIAGNVETLVVKDSFIYDTELPFSNIQMISHIYSDFTWENDSSIAGLAKDSISGIENVLLQVKNLSDDTYWDNEGWVEDSSWIEAFGSSYWYYQLDKEQLEDGSLYRIFSIAVDSAGNIQSDSTYFDFIFDISGPSKGWVYDGLSEQDISWSNNITSIQSRWTGFSDATSNITSYHVSVGTDSGGADLIEWTDIGLDTFFIFDQLELDNGLRYFFNVKASDEINNFSPIATSNGVTIDTSPPVISNVFEGGYNDPSYQGDTTQILINCMADDDFSGVASYAFSLGVFEGDTSISSWKQNIQDSIYIFDNLSLENSNKYWANALVADSAGNISEVAFGNGIIIDITGPSVGTSIDLSPINEVEDQIYTPSDSLIIASWIGFKDSLSGIGRYEYSITTDDTVLVNWTSTGLDTIMSDSSLILINGQQYFSHIRAFDEVGNVSSVITTDGITADLDGPIGTYVSDGDSVDIDRQNNLVNYNGFWSEFTDQRSGLLGYEIALYDTKDSLVIVDWNFTDTDTFFRFENITLLPNHTYELHVLGIDSVLNKGPIIKSDGVFIDIEAPATPKNLIGKFSSERIDLSWSASPVNDFGYFIVYAGEDSSAMESILETITPLANAFTNEFSDGNKYYFRVSSVDDSGNESPQSALVYGIPQLAKINRTHPDTTYILHPSDKTLRFKFSQPLYNPGIPSISSAVYDNMRYEMSYSDDDTALTLTLLDQIASLDTILIAINNTEDWAGNISDISEISFHSFLLGDYDQNFHIDVHDVALFVDAWGNNDVHNELGPVNGSVPNLIQELDQKFNMRDVMVFKRMWDWSNLSPPDMFVFKSKKGLDLNVIQEGNDLVISLPENIKASEFLIDYNYNSDESLPFSFRTIKGENIVTFQKFYEESKKFLYTSAYSPTDKSKSGKEIRLKINSESESGFNLSIGYKVIGVSDIVVAKGISELTFFPTPEEYALLQNYPNPFNPVTNIKYQLVNSGDVSIIIYDIMGREVNNIINAYKTAGYHSVTWNGQHRNGEKMAAGIYFYMIKVNNFKQVRKMILLK